MAVTRRWWQYLGLAIATALFTLNCQQSTPNESPTTPDPAATPSAKPLTLNGTGASLPLFLYERIFGEYCKQVNPDVQVNVQRRFAAGIV